jgi:hypothetical protein
MILKGFCKSQNKEYAIDVDAINAKCHDDNGKDTFIFGRINCEYASNTMDCDGKCTILDEYKKRLGL